MGQIVDKLFKKTNIQSLSIKILLNIRIVWSRINIVGEKRIVLIKNIFTYKVEINFCNPNYLGSKMWTKGKKYLLLHRQMQIKRVNL